MKRKLLSLFLITVVIAVIGCTSDKAWRKAAVDTYEILGVGIATTPTIGESLRASNLIDDAQLGRIKAVYNKAKAIYASAGGALKLASAADTEAKKEEALRNYGVLIADFNKLTLEIVDLINSFSKKKVSVLEIRELISEGGAL